MYENDEIFDLDYDGINLITFDKPEMGRIFSNFTNDNDPQNSYLEARINEDQNLDIITTRLFPSYINHNTDDTIMLTVRYYCGQIIKTWVNVCNKFFIKN